MCCVHQGFVSATSNKTFTRLFFFRAAFFSTVNQAPLVGLHCCQGLAQHEKEQTCPVLQHFSEDIEAKPGHDEVRSTNDQGSLESQKSSICTHFTHIPDTAKHRAARQQSSNPHGRHDYVNPLRGIVESQTTTNKTERRRRRRPGTAPSPG
ncbi:hypothetical protein VTI74DRAFT_2590 [Chaetomium olivicolor]